MSCIRTKFLALVAKQLAILALIAIGTTAQAQLIIEPTFNTIDPSSGVGVGLLAAVPTLTEPGNVFSYVSGDPADPELDTVHFVNDTTHAFTGFGLTIVGTGTDTHDPSTIVRGAPIDARFGDVTGDGQIVSDIFSTVTISNDGKTILFTDGLIPIGGHFTVNHLAISTPPGVLAGIDSWYLVPEPSTGILSVIGSLTLLLRRRRT